MQVAGPSLRSLGGLGICICSVSEAGGPGTWLKEILDVVPGGRPHEQGSWLGPTSVLSLI